MGLIESATKDKNRVLNIAIIILALIIAGNIYQQQAKKIESLKRKNEMETKKNVVMGSISKEEKTINAYKNLLVKKDAGYIINTFSNIAKESAVNIVSIKPVHQQEQSAQDYIKSSFSLILNASNYHAIGNFIGKLESYQDVYIVESIDIKSKAQSNELTASLIVNSVVFAD